jgi:hypothetical protein
MRRGELNQPRAVRLNHIRTRAIVGLSQRGSTLNKKIIKPAAERATERGDLENPTSRRPSGRPAASTASLA